MTHMVYRVWYKQGCFHSLEVVSMAAVKAHFWDCHVAAIFAEWSELGKQQKFSFFFKESLVMFIL